MARKKKTIECMEYLSVVAPVEKAYMLENKQRKYIREYVANKEYKIVGTMRRNGFSQRDVNKQWLELVAKIQRKQVQGVVIANMAAVAEDLPDAYKKVGQIIAAGGIIVTVDEGRLGMANLEVL